MVVRKETKPVEEDEMGVFMRPIIDSQNPPIAVDHFFVEQLGNRIRYSGSTNWALYNETGRIVTNRGDKKAKEVTFRPVCVFEAGGVALLQLALAAIPALAQDSQSVRVFFENQPDAKKEVVADLKNLLKTLSE